MSLKAKLEAIIYAAETPITLDLGSWRGGLTMLVGVILIGAAIYSYRIALAHRKVFNDIDG